MFKSLFLPIIGVMAFITITGLMYQGKLDFLTDKVSNQIQNQDKKIKIGQTEIVVDVAKSNEERARGLSNVESLDKNKGMLFVFDGNSRPVFWMKDTKIALDIIWIEDDKIVSIDKNVQPEPNTPDNKLKRYYAPTNVDYVLEVNAGFSEENDIKVGQSLSGLEQL